MALSPVLARPHLLTVEGFTQRTGCQSDSGALVSGRGGHLTLIRVSSCSPQVMTLNAPGGAGGRVPELFRLKLLSLGHRRGGGGCPSTAVLSARLCKDCLSPNGGLANCPRHPGGGRLLEGGLPSGTPPGVQCFCSPPVRPCSPPVLPCSHPTSGRQVLSPSQEAVSVYHLGSGPGWSGPAGGAPSERPVLPARHTAESQGSAGRSDQPQSPRC